VGRASHSPKVAVATPPVAVAPPPVVAPPPTIPTTTAPSTETKAATEKAGEEEATEAASEKDEKDEKDTTAKAEGETETITGKTTKPARGGAAGAEAKKMLADADRLLRAERFGEARDIFQKLTKSKKERGPALVGLAEISFQEKKYADAARTAEKAAAGGGGVKARVLLGDAHFRLARYKEAARAYEEALKIDPGNASAKSGLALANKRM